MVAAVGYRKEAKAETSECVDCKGTGKIVNPDKTTRDCTTCRKSKPTDEKDRSPDMIKYSETMQAFENSRTVISLILDNPPLSWTQSQLLQIRALLQRLIQLFEKLKDAFAQTGKTNEVASQIIATSSTMKAALPRTPEADPIRTELTNLNVLTAGLKK